MKYGCGDNVTEPFNEVTGKKQKQKFAEGLLQEVKRQTKADKKMQKTMHEFKHGKLRSGSKHGPRVKSRKQAIAIGLNQARRAGARIPRP